MSIEISPEIEKLLGHKVGGGGYTSTDDVLSQALHLLDDHGEFLEMRREEIRAKIDAGRQSLVCGEGVDGEKVFERLFKELYKLERRPSK